MNRTASGIYALEAPLWPSSDCAASCRALGIFSLIIMVHPYISCSGPACVSNLVCAPEIVLSYAQVKGWPRGNCLLGFGDRALMCAYCSDI